MRKENGDVVYSAEGSKLLSMSFRDIMLREFNYVHWKHDRSTKQKACPNICKASQKPVEPYVFEATKSPYFEKTMVMGDPMVEPLWRTHCTLETLEESRPKLKDDMEKNIDGKFLIDVLLKWLCSIDNHDYCINGERSPSPILTE